MYLIFTIIFGIHLSRWDQDEPGLCYNTKAITLPNDLHPSADLGYLSVTCVFFYTALIGAVLGPVIIPGISLNPTALMNGFIDKTKELDNRIIASLLLFALGTTVGPPPVEEELLERSVSIFLLAMLQLPVHLYFVIALRAVNQPLLEGGGSEAKYWLWKRSFRPANEQVEVGSPTPAVNLTPQGNQTEIPAQTSDSAVRTA
ncbi:hypothetical protein FQN54_003594 [Arachnomyces sp. PD_36]|nr:hypothetical protein FQN54_003594 [Arachnomyces sp. PD_36]